MVVRDVYGGVLDRILKERLQAVRPSSLKRRTKTHKDTDNFLVTGRRMFRLNTHLN
jgi:hypothetical protein